MHKKLKITLGFVLLSFIALVVVYAIFPSRHQQKFVRKISAYPMDETVGRFKAIAYDEGFTILEDFDHQALAHEAGLDLLPTEVVLLGKPAMGTRIIQENCATALVLPLKMMIWEGKDHTVSIGYINPIFMGGLFKIKKSKRDLEVMENYLDVLTDRATI